MGAEFIRHLAGGRNIPHRISLNRISLISLGWGRMENWPFFTIEKNRVMAGAVFEVIESWKRAEEGLEYPGYAYETELSTYHDLKLHGWILLDEETLEDFIETIRTRHNFEHVKAVYSENTGSYYIFTKDDTIYHFTKSDVAYHNLYHPNKDFIQSILEEEEALGNNQIPSSLRQLMSKDIYYGEVYDVELRLFGNESNKPITSLYVLAHIRNVVTDEEKTCWRRLELSRVCIYQDDDDCYISLVNDFFKP
jgi:hypothetical protein